MITTILLQVIELSDVLFHVPCRRCKISHSLRHTILERWYTWPTRLLRDHGVAVLQIRSFGAQSNEAVQTWISLLEASG
jgi:hypothetical protein